MVENNTSLSVLLKNKEEELVSGWVGEQSAALSGRVDLIKASELRVQCRDFLGLLCQATQSGDLEDILAPEWDLVLEMLGTISRTRVLQGFTPSETATFIFSLKKPLVAELQKAMADDPVGFASEQWKATLLLDKLGLWTTEVYQKSREEIISRQQQELLEVSTPVVKLWEGVLAVPLIGTLDSARTQIVMEALLQMIVDTGSELAIIDITGVPTVDTLTAQHLLKTVAAARLMGADCIISGIRPQIAQTIVHLGVDLSAVVTKATMADAFRTALQRLGLALVRPSLKA